MPSTYAHFIGVGGAGMSGIALVLHERGVAVTGSDLRESRYSRALAAAGVPIHIGHDAANLGDPEVVVVSSAIPEANPELAEARRRGVEVWPRARMLAHLAEGRKTIAIAGTHGKTSTSSMVAAMLAGMGMEPSFLIGGELDGFNTNAVNGAGEHYVVEADESDGSFVYLDPFVALLTNVEADHMDHYESLEQITHTFVEFTARTAENGFVVACADDEGALGVASGSGRRVITYGFAANADVRCEVIDRLGAGYRFCAWVGAQRVEASTCIPGLHMVSNATGALACAHALGLDLSDAGRALSGFSGVRRRFDRVGEVAGVTIVDDYAHHPTEVAATLEAAAGLGYRRVWALFQPHRYSRTAAFAREFGRAFGSADRVALMDVYSAGETPIPGIDGKTLVTSVLEQRPRTAVAYLPHRLDVVPYLAAHVAPGDLVLTMGAGDITSLGPELLVALSEIAATGS
ncbi:MAG: UDP-N-acetylmuramate--L-alanine ligase [Coriobacteriia bacterium]|nr:UDP-N-acetylmuramate--L-alanine ligase [Coriobacteriia bacterium]